MIPPKNTIPQTRRHFLRRCFGSSCGFGATLLLAPVAARKSYGQDSIGKVIGSRPFARVEEVSEGVWALVSTPFTADGKSGDLTTHSNGGLIIGKERILAVDSYRTAEGARYLVEACKFLTGRTPTHIVNTHFHFDHLGGTRGFLQADTAPEVIMTQTTRELAFSTYLKTTPNEEKPNFGISTINKWGGDLTDASMVITDETNPFTLDLGGRTVTITPMSGHTHSDLVVRDDKTRALFAGDLIWDGIFPNFMSASPLQWRKTVTTILGEKDAPIIPGHGSISKAGDEGMKRYQNLLELIETHARAEHTKGRSSDAAAASLKLPTSLGDISYFRNGFHEIAMDTWFREIGKSQ